MRAAPLCILLLLALVFPAGSHAQEQRTGLSPEQWRHWAIKVSATSATYETLRLLRTDSDLAAAVATAAPTVAGKLLYMPRGLSDDPTRRWPDPAFVVKDVAGELCIQSAPLWLRLATGGPKEERVIRSVAAVGGYAVAVFGCARMLEVR